MHSIHPVRDLPAFCQYADGPCDQSFESESQTRGLLLFPSEPAAIATTMETATAALRLQGGTWRTWRDLNPTGQLIFCTICKGARFADVVVTDVTTLNFNLLFEIGFALGLNQPVIPVRDTTYMRDKHAFEELGLLDTLGYLDFQNSEGLATAIRARQPFHALPPLESAINIEAPLYVLKGPIDLDATIRLFSILKKSALRFRTYDAKETPRLSLQEARRQVATSLAVIAHLYAPERHGALAHNARCALIGGMALASQKAVLLLQEGSQIQPIDYRDIIRPYSAPSQIEQHIEPLIRSVVSGLQNRSGTKPKPAARLLERVNLGDVAAENEIQGLRTYFFPTAQFNDARRGNARLVVGRKGSGKTAIFYAIRDSIKDRRADLVLDLKPEGHQFTRFHETVLSQLTPGVQEHTLSAFWYYILLCEIAQKVVDHEFSWAQRDETRRVRFEALKASYSVNGVPGEGDFSERLLQQVERMNERHRQIGLPFSGGDITENLFRGEIPRLQRDVIAYLAEKDTLWVLVDNLDKGWPTRGATREDILILRSLLEAVRKLQQELDRAGVDVRALIFIRNDIYEHLLEETPDKGKDTVTLLDWNDEDAFRELVRRRLLLADGLDGTFVEMWRAICASHVGTTESFQYVLERTLLRPRDLLNFLHRAVEVAINRGHSVVEADDMLHAETQYSEDMLLTVGFEIRDVLPECGDLLYAFLGCPVAMTQHEVRQRLVDAGLSGPGLERATELLLWFGVLGVRDGAVSEPRYAHQVRYNLRKLRAPVERGSGSFVIHPAFHRALECTS